MRLRRLDLLRYGHFTDAAFSLPAGQPDLHIIFGPNEAGKSTTLCAIEDLLFGFPRLSPFNFIHGYGDLRVGGVLEHLDRVLTVRRRKGNRDTLLGPDDSPLPEGEGALRFFMGSADPAFFRRMFSLDHERLAQGGREILQARNEVGQTLFAASTGLSGLRERLKSLDDQADALWAPRKANRRAYYAAADAFDAANRALRERTVTAGEWQSARQRLDEARETQDSARDAVAQDDAELRKLSRIRRVYRDLHALAGVEAELVALGEVPHLPEDAQATLASARRDLADVTFKRSEIVRQREQLAAECAALHVDAALLQRAPEIEQIRVQRIEILKEKADLPRLRAQLAAREQQLMMRARELGWQESNFATIAPRIPPRADEATAKALLSRRGSLVEAVENAQSNLAESTRKLNESRQQSSLQADAGDVSLIAAEIAAVRRSGDLEAHLDGGRQRLADLGIDISQRLDRLRPHVTSTEILQTLPVPPRETVQRQRDRLRDLEQKSRACHDAIAELDKSIRTLRRTLEQRRRTDAIPAVEDVLRVRGERDAGWALIRQHFIEGTPATGSALDALAVSMAELPAFYEDRLRAADRLADERYDRITALAALAELDRQIEDLSAVRTERQRESSVLAEDRETLDAGWRALWAGAPFDPLSPDAMLAWLEDRAELLARADGCSKQAGEVARLEAAAQRTRAGLMRELRAFGEQDDGLAACSIATLLERAMALQQLHEVRARERVRAKEQVRELEREEDHRTEQLDRARAALDRWQHDWRTTVQTLGLAPDAALERVANHLEIIEHMRSTAYEAAQLRNDRIVPMEEDIAAFEAAARALVGGIASDLAQQAPDDAIPVLEERLAAARRTREQQDEKEAAITTLDERIAQYERDESGAQHVIERLQQAAGATDLIQLENAIRRSQQQGELVRTRQSLQDALEAAADGLPLEELRAECREADLDRVVERETALRSEREARQRDLTQAALNQAEAQRTFDAIGGSAGAIEAASERQEALASMREAAGQYVRVRSAALLLQWAMERYRRDMQGPLLGRAGKLFAALTLESFTGLRIGYDEHDAPRLTGVRPDGSQVDVAGMSEGTTDQLYLALRIASIDEYLDHGHPLPLVADDLFVNFDDARAAAGLKVLAQLAHRTQVLFFTHHHHLVEIARAVLGSDTSVIELQHAVEQNI